MHTLMVISATEPSVMTWSRLCIALMGVLRPIKEGGFVQGRIDSDRARFLASVPTPLYCRVLKTDCSFKERCSDSKRRHKQGKTQETLQLETCYCISQ